MRMRTLPRYLVAVLLLLAIHSDSQAQALCGGNPRLENFCGDACIVCELDGVTLTTTHSIVGTVPPGYCTFIAHSMQWIGFVAGTPNLSFRVDVTGCTMGNSIELGVYETMDCGSFNLVSNCNTAMPVGSYNFSNTTPLKPGCYYYIVIDGNGPASCTFNVTVTAGSTTAPEPVITDPISGKDKVCEGETITYSIPEVYGACDYNWEVTGGSVLGPTDQETVTVLWDQPSSGEVCITASNVCNSSDRVCLPIYIHPTPQETFIGPFEICAGNAYPYNGRFYPAGVWPITFKNQYGCDTTVVLEVVEIPIETNTIQEVICYPDCYTLGSETICESGQYTEILQSRIEPFCDSIVVLDLEILHVEAEADKDGDLSCSDTLVTLFSDSSIVGPNGTFKRVWKNLDGDSLGDGTTLEVCDTGYYILHLSLTTPLGSCEDADTIFVGGSPEGPQLIYPDTVFVCRGEALILSEIPIVDRNGATISPEFFEDLPSLPSPKINTDTLYPDMPRDIGVLIDIGGCMDEGLFHVEILPNPLFSLPDTIDQCPDEIFEFSSVNVNFSGPDSSGLIWLLRDSTGDLDTLQDNILLDSSGWLIALPDSGICLPVDSVFIHVLPVLSPAFEIPDTLCLDENLELIYTGSPVNQASFYWDVNGVKYTGAGPHNISLDTSGTWDISLLLERSGCFSDTLKRILQVSPPPQQPDLTCDVIDSTLFIRWNIDPGTRVYNGFPDPAGPQGQLLNDSTWVFRDVPTGTSVRFVLISEGFGPCSDASDSIECLVIFCPNVQVDIDSIMPICLPDQNSPISLSYSAPGILNLDPQWVGPGITDPENGVFDPAVAGEGLHEITLELRDNFCQYNSTTFIRVYDPAIINFNLPDSICLGDSIVLSGDSAQQGYVLNRDLGDARIIRDLGNGELLITWDQAGRKTISINQENSSCSSEINTKNVEVISPLPPIKINCEPDYESINFNWDLIPGVSEYEVTVLPSGPAQIISANNFTVDGLLAGDSVSILIMPVWDGPCTVEPVEIKCKTLPCPNITIDITSVPNICLASDTEPVQLELDIVNSPGSGSISWAGPGTDLSGLFDPKMTGQGSHLVTANYEIYGCSYSESITIEVYDAPMIDISGSDILNCAEPESQLSLDILTNTQGTTIWTTPSGTQTNDTIIANTGGWYVALFTDTVSGCTTEDSLFLSEEFDGPEEVEFATENAKCSPPNTGSIDIRQIIGGTPVYTVFLDGVRQQGAGVISNLAAGSYTLEIEDANGCLLDTVITIGMTPPLTLTLERDTVIERGSSVRLISSANRNISNYSWSPAVPCGNCPDPLVSPTSDTRYFLMATDENGCTAEASVLIRVFQKSYFIPNAFTPNDDGVNDRFNISGNDFVDLVETMQIFDRWGNQVCSLNNIDPRDPDAGWDGTVNNKALNPGVYVYCLRIRFTDGTIENRCGDITLLR